MKDIVAFIYFAKIATIPFQDGIVDIDRHRAEPSCAIMDSLQDSLYLSSILESS